MRTIAVLLLMLAISGANDTAKAEPSSCKQCRDQQQACMKNYSGKTCKIEYDICMKSWQKK